MFTRITRSATVRLGAVTLTVLTTCALSALGASGTWNVNAGGNWSNTANWLGATIADGAGDTANFSLVNITAQRIVTIDGAVASRTIGTLLIGDSNVAVNANYIINANSGGTLTFNNLGSDAVLTQIATSFGDTISAPMILADHLGATNNAATLFTLSGGFTGAKNLTLNAASTGGITISVGSANNGGTISNIGSGSGTTTISSVIGTNVTGVVQNSATSQLTLSAANTFTGGLTVRAGTLVGQTSATALGLGLVTLGDSSGSANASILANGITLVRPITVGSGSSGTLSLGNVGSSSGVFSGAITLANNLTLTSGGTGSTRLSGGITGTGNLTLNAAGSTSTVTIDTNGVNHIGTITNIGTSIGNANLNSVIGANVTGITHNSATSNLSISGANTAFAGGVTVKAGTVVTLNNAALGTAAVTLGDTSGSANASVNSNAAAHSNAINVIAGSSGTLSLANNGAATAPTFSGAVTLANNLTVASTGTGSTTLTGGITGTGNVTLNAAGTTSTVGLNTISVNNIGSITNQGTSTGTATIGAVIGANVTSVNQNNSSSQLTVSAANTAFAGSVNVNAGTLQANNASAFNANNVVAISSGATFSIGDLSISHAGLNDGSGGGSWTGNAASARTLTLAGGGNYSFGGAISGTNRGLNVALTGTGSQLLGGTNTYAGPTNLSSGSLLVNGSIGSGAVSVTGGTLSGTGAIGGSVTITSATLSPGASPGTLSMANLTLNTSAATLIELGGATPGDGSGFYDQLDVAGNANLAGSLTINTFGGYVAGPGPYYILARAAGTGSFTGLGEGAVVLIDGIVSANITYAANWLGSQGASTLTGGNDVAIYNVEVVPEPTAAGILIAGLALALRRRRR